MNKDKMNELKREYDSVEVPPELDLAIEKGIRKGKDYKRKTGIKSFALVAATLALAVGIGSAGNFFSTKDTSLIAIDSSKTLPTVGSSQNLEKLLKNYIGQNNDVKYSTDTAMNTSKSGNMPQTASEKSNLDSNASNAILDHSTTNLQVQGVDEEDLIKTDGEYIFKVNSQKIINVIKAEPASNMESVSNITFEDNYNINGIYLRKNILVVVGNSYQNIDTQKGGQSNSSYKIPSYVVTKVKSFDVSDKKNIKKIRDIEIDGSYASSRMIGSRVYVITNKYINNIDKAYYSDTAIGSDKITIDYNKINYLPDSIEPNYIMVAAYNVDDNKEKVNINTILGSGNNIYSSNKNLYIAGTKWTQDGNKNGSTNTILYKFAYENTSVKFVTKGEVPGTIINQFSMDERNDNFRIATTEYNYSIAKPAVDEKATSTVDKNMISPAQNKITNNLFIMDKDMKTVGKLQGLANGEKIYSVRFIGERAYIVTFMLTDPLFVIDLKKPTSPKVLGELKIPGFTNYLHPYDETHLIGFGMDTTVVNEGGVDRARPQGLKIAMFDVRNVAKPVQQFMTIVGVGTYSEVLNNHKALLFSKEKNLLALPVTNSQQNSQGAYIYNIDLVNGIKLKGKITHMDETNSSTGQYSVDRILYIKDTLYTLSNGLIKANDINTLQEKSKLNLKTIDPSKVYPMDVQTK